MSRLGVIQKWTSGLLGIFGAVVLVGSPIVGLVSDGGTSRKPAYTFGLACLVGGISALAITNQLWMLVVSRILQGISAAVVFTVGLAIVADSVEPRDIGYYTRHVISSMSCGVLMGPFFGIIAFNFAGHFAVVGLMALTALVDIILRVFMIEKSEAKVYGDLWSICTAMTSGNPSFLDLPGLSLFFLVPFVVIIASFDAVLPIFLEDVLGWTSFKVTLCFLAVAIPNALLGPVAGMLSDKCAKSKYGFCALFWWLSISTAASFNISPLAADLLFVVDMLVSKGDTAAYAQSYGLFTSAMAGGTLVGPVLGGYLKETFGWTTMTWGLGICAASGAIPVET
ncbi:hypothetical protein IFR04_010006 [Cadophora malorum]|uniref:Major facilitator superfamily (MFS) profile domain-containing protein n=1 Tax=Cadophora malorum TaxID=108018 RepID=A0A8H7W9X9_9HELO|nr:hypothetical protein IFR04_010006 [Cadophora malorum]